MPSAAPPITARPVAPAPTAAPPASASAARPSSPLPAAQPTAAARTAAPAKSPGGAASTAGLRATLEQALSDEAQGTTIAFDGLAFLTGTLGSDSFFPPGKVADFWGFQYLRDNDPSEMGHNTDFLTRASLNMLQTLSSAQRAELGALAKSQVASINEYGMKRFVLMKAFRRLLEGDLPAGTTGLDRAAVMAYSAELYRLDGRMSYDRAKVMGGILRSLSATQRAALDALVGTGMTSWPVAAEPAELRGLDHDTKVAVMTYAGDLFSWYAGSLEADVYFCPERHGTYFGSFYMKDAPAVGNPGYSIGTQITAEMGRAFLAALSPAQAAQITSLVEIQRDDLAGIVSARRDIATALRRFIAGESPDDAAVLGLAAGYGERDGEIAYYLATHFAKVGATLTSAQQAALAALRTQTLGSYRPKGAFLYAEEIPLPAIPSTDFLFGTTPEPPAPTARPQARPGAATPAPGGGTAPADHVGGRVRSVSGTTIVIEDPQGRPTTIQTDAATVFSAAGGTASLGSVGAGSSIEVTGRRSGDGSWLATRVEVSDRPPAPR